MKKITQPYHIIPDKKDPHYWAISNIVRRPWLECVCPQLGIVNPYEQIIGEVYLYSNLGDDGNCFSGHNIITQACGWGHPEVGFFAIINKSDILIRLGSLPPKHAKSEVFR